MCREYQRGVCRRTESECRFAHPPEGVAVEVMMLAARSPVSPQSTPGHQAAVELSVSSTEPSDEPPSSTPPVASSGLFFSTVTVCMDACRGRCSRPSCRYFHPPQHLLDAVRLRTRNSAATAPPPPIDAASHFPAAVLFFFLLLSPPSVPTDRLAHRVFSRLFFLI